MVAGQSPTTKINNSRLHHFYHIRLSKPLEGDTQHMQGISNVEKVAHLDISSTSDCLDELILKICAITLIF